MADPKASDIQMPEATPSPCGGCESQRMSPLACGSCGLLADVDRHPSPFQLFGLAPTWTVCPVEIRKRWTRISRLTHPDLHAASEEKLVLAERHTAELNEAYQLLLSDQARADWLITHLDGPPESKTVAADFLMEVMEWNETLDEITSPEEAATLAAEIQHHQIEALQKLRTLLDPLPERGAPALTEARETLNSIRYLVRILDRAKELRA